MDRDPQIAHAARLVLLRTIRRLQDRASMNDRNAEAPGKTDREFWESRARAQAYLVAAADLHSAIDDLSEELEKLAHESG